MSLLAVLAFCANAENTTANIGMPGLGLVFDSKRAAVRPVVGTPGAAIIGPGVSVDSPPATIVAGGGSFLVMAAEDSTIRAVTLRGPSAEARAIEGAIRAPDRIVLSPSGGTVLLCDSKAAIVQVLTGLADSPVAGKQISLAELGGMDGWKLAVSDDGSRLAIGLGAMLWLVDVGGSRAAIPLQTDVAAVAFLPGKVEAVTLLTSGALLRVSAGGVETFGQIAGAAGLDAVGLQVATNGQRAFVAYAQGSLAVVEPGPVETKLISCGCTPTGLMPSTRPGLYRLNEVSAPPLLLWDVSGSLPRVWFVPDATAGDGE